MLVALREAFEAALLVAIVLLYLNRVGLRQYHKYLMIGVAVGVVASTVFGAVAYGAYLFVEDKELAEAAGAFIAVPVLTSIIYWMARKGPGIKEEIEREVRRRISISGALGMITLGIIFVFREGLETVLFILPLIFIQPLESMAGIIIGTVIAIIITYFIFVVGARINIRSFFLFTSILLIFVASGILGYGVHELIEYGEDKGWSIEPWSNTVYNLNIPRDNMLHEKNVIGGMLAVLIGYSTKMELLRLILQLSYLVVGLALIIYAYKSPTRK